MNITELHDEENLLMQMQDRWENYGYQPAIDYCKEHGYKWY